MDTVQPAETGEMTKTEYEQLAGFRYALRLFFAFSEGHVRSVGMTPRQYQALLAIKGYPGREQATIGELAEQLQLKHNSTVELIDRLVEERLAERHRDGSNRKQVYVRLTDRGEEILMQLAATHRQQLQRLSPQLLAALRSLTSA